MSLSPPSGDASSGKEEASEVEDELGDSKRGPTHHRQVPLQDHKKYGHTLLGGLTAWPMSYSWAQTGHQVPRQLLYTKHVYYVMIDQSI